MSSDRDPTWSEIEAVTVTRWPDGSRHMGNDLEIELRMAREAYAALDKRALATAQAWAEVAELERARRIHAEDELAAARAATIRGIRAARGAIPVIYLAHPAGAKTMDEHRANLARARCWFKWAADGGAAVVADWILYCEVWDDGDAKLRARGLEHDDAQIVRCDEVWLCGGRISAGMARATRTAARAGIGCRDFTSFTSAPEYLPPSSHGLLPALRLGALEPTTEIGGQPGDTNQRPKRSGQ